VLYPHHLPEEQVARHGNRDENEQSGAISDVDISTLVRLRADRQKIGRHEEHAQINSIKNRKYGIADIP